MAHIVLGSSRHHRVFQKANSILGEREHKVVVLHKAKEFINYLKDKTPDILVFSFDMEGFSQYQLVEEILQFITVNKTRAILIPFHDNSTGEPLVNWKSNEFSNFLADPVSEWQIVLAVEQLLYRSITNVARQD